MENLSMDTIIIFNGKRLVLGDIRANMQTQLPDEQFYDSVRAWIRSGKARVEDTRTKEDKIMDKIYDELMTIEKGEGIKECRRQEEVASASTLGVYKKVGFPAKSLLDAQEMMAQLTTSYNIPGNQVGLVMENGQTLVTITDCPIKTYQSLEIAFGTKKVAQAVTGGVNRAVNNVINITDVAATNVVVPVAKTAITATGKIARSLLGLGAKIGGMAIAETIRTTKDCADTIKNDSYVAEAKGELTDGMQAIRRSIKTPSFGMTGTILEQ